MKYLWVAFLVIFSGLNSAEIPEEMLKIMKKEKYKHSIWGILVKDLQTGKVVLDRNSDKLFSPASTTKLFAVAALLNAFGTEYRFQTPVYANGQIENGTLQGDLILVAQGDLTMGGREASPDKISFTNLDHTIANEIPGASITPEDPLNGLNELAKQIRQKGITKVVGDIIIDDGLFETIEKRGLIISPIIINENMIDIIVNPAKVSEDANVDWRPKIPDYTVENKVKTVAKGEVDINVTTQGSKIIVEGTIPIDQKNIIRTVPIEDPILFARTAFIQALKQNGIEVDLVTNNPPENKLAQQIAVRVSPPLSEYAKLILKVSHNLGADLIPLLLASHAGKKTFDEGMLQLGNFVTQEVKISPNAFVFVDAAGGNENRLTPEAEVQLLEYVFKKPKKFPTLFEALPILGVDGTLADYAKDTEAAGKVRAKTGTGVSFNLATGKFFLITKTTAGYISGKNGHLFSYVVVVNNATMPTIKDIFPIFEDLGQISNIIFKNTK